MRIKRRTTLFIVSNSSPGYSCLLHMIEYLPVLLMALFGVATSLSCYDYEGIHSELSKFENRCTREAGESCFAVKGGGFIVTRCSKNCDNDQEHLRRRLKEIAATHCTVIPEKEIGTICCIGPLCIRAEVDDSIRHTKCYEFSGKRGANSAERASMCLRKHHCLTASVGDIVVTKGVYQCNDLNKQVVTAEAKNLAMALGYPSQEEVEINCCTFNECNKEYVHPRPATLSSTSVTPKSKTTVGKITTKKDTTRNKDTPGGEDTTGNKDETGENGANGDEWFRGWQIGYGSEAGNFANASNGTNYFSSLFAYILGLFSIFYGLQ